MAAPVHTPTAAASHALERIVNARATRNPLRIHGAGTWLTAGRPVAATTPLSLEGARGVVEYVPGDLTMTVGAATSLAEIASVTQAERQWLALDPAGGGSGSIGATVATNSSGPLAHAFGAPRDQVLGLECVTGAGTVVRGGGRVVKNVAGFDLTRLMVGSWGTLGVLTEVSLRLRALPETETTVALALPGESAALKGTLSRLAEAHLGAFALEMVSGALAQRIGLGDAPFLLARLGGNADLVSAQQATLASLGDLQKNVGPAAWTHVQSCDDGGTVVLRLSQRRSEMADSWERGSAIARTCGGLVHGSPARGIVRVALPGDPGALAAPLRAELHRFKGTVVFERLSPSLWTDLARPTALDPLSRSVKRAFDPDGILNPGILGDPAP